MKALLRDFLRKVLLSVVFEKEVNRDCTGK